MDTEPTTVSLGQVPRVLRRRGRWILACFFLTGGAAYRFSKRQTKKGAATASSVFDNNQPRQQGAGLPVVNSNNQQAQQNTNVKLVQLGDMVAKTASLLDQGLTKEKVSEELRVRAQGESNMVNVSGTSTSWALADIANTYKHMRTFPSSSCVELNVWRHIAEEVLWWRSPICL